MSLILVNWTKPRILRTASAANGTVMFAPGVNEIDADLFAAICKTHPSLAELIEEGALEVIVTSTGDRVAAGDLPKLAPKDALKIVKATVNKDMLEGWLATEKRKPVADAIKKQLAELAKAAEPDAKDKP